MRTVDGFTLIETMIVVTVAGIILAIGMPAFSRYRSTLALEQAKAQLRHDVRDARQRAVTRRIPVYMQFGTPPATSGITSYRVHVDANGNRLVDTGESVSNHRLPANTSLSLVSLTPIDTLNFDISGILWPGHLGGSLVVSNSRGQRDTMFVSSAGIVYEP